VLRATLALRSESRHHGVVRVALSVGCVVVLSAAGCGRVGFDPRPARDSGLDAGREGDAGFADATLPLLGAEAVYFAGGDGLTDSAGSGPRASCDPCPERVVVDGVEAWDFAGGTVVRIRDDGRFDGTDGFTVALFSRYAGSGYTTLVCKRFGAGFLNSYKLAYRPDLDFESTDGSVRRMREGSSPVDGRWIHYAAVWDGSEKSLYLDGELAISMAEPSIEFDGGDILVGADEDGSEPPKEIFEGLVRELWIFGRPLDPTEIAELAAR